MRDEGATVAFRAALGWLVLANGIGLWLAGLLAFSPVWMDRVGSWYGRLVPMHLNLQLYGWTALPLIGWLLKGYRVGGGGGRWAVGAWNGALVLGVWDLWQGRTSGKIFLDWSGGSRCGLMVAMGVLWGVLLGGWWRGKGEESRSGRWIRLGLLGSLAVVPLVMWVATSPKTYPPIDVSTGGPTGSSLLGSTLVVVGMMMALPEVAGLEKRGGDKGRWWVAGWYGGVSLVCFGVTEFRGGTHHEIEQIAALGMLLPWVVWVPVRWSRYRWPEGAGFWRVAVVVWWGILVGSGWVMYLPGVLDRLKFTQGLVGHSHLAMAGFTTSFLGLLMSLNGEVVGNRVSRMMWQVGAALMIVALVGMGMMEGRGYGWMWERVWWRDGGMWIRWGAGAVMAVASVHWWWSMRERSLGS